MSLPTPVLATKFYIPPLRPNVVNRRRLIDQLNHGLQGKLTLVSAPAGFGKTTVVCDWVRQCGRPVVWLSLDKEESDPLRFLFYLVSAIRQFSPTVGETIVSALQLPQSPPADSLLTMLLNELAATEAFVLVLDDYHMIDSQQVDQLLGFFVERLPSQHHLVIATREDPNLSLARLRARGQLSEVRASDLRFTLNEAIDFLNQAMGLSLTTDEVNALEHRTEGWIAGLQLAALSLQRQGDSGSFIKSFTGNHHFVMDYLLEEVLHQQPEAIQTFLLRTSILNRFCAPLCDFVLRDESPHESPLATRHSQSILEYLEQANLFTIPLDNERRWYRYHQLFAELLRQRLPQHLASFPNEQKQTVGALHSRASQWFEENDLDIEAFQHATAANDIERAERLIDGKGIPLHLRGAALMISDWLESLPEEILRARPWLWWRQAALLLVNGHTTGVAEKLQAAEDALQSTEWDERLGDKTRGFVGRIATARSVLALTSYDVGQMLAQSQRALKYLDASALSARSNACWTGGMAHFWMGNRTAARTAYLESIALGEASGDIFATSLALSGLADVQRMDGELHAAADTYHKVLQLAGDQPLQIISQAHLGLAHLFYEWNDLEAAEAHGQKSLQLARQYEQVIDRFVISELFLVRLSLARGQITEAVETVTQIAATVQQRKFVHRKAEVAEAQAATWLRQGNWQAATNLLQHHDLPLCRARLLLAQGETKAALALLRSIVEESVAKGWVDEMLRAQLLQAIAHHTDGSDDEAWQILGELLQAAQPGGYIRLFVDEGLPMAELLKKLAQHETASTYVRKLLASFPDSAFRHSQSELIEPLSEREIEVLQLLAAGHSDQEIANRLLVSLNTVRYHTKNLYGKLGVNKRTQAVAKAQELKLLMKFENQNRYL